MDRIMLVELKEGETAKLSPRGRELWEEIEALVELSPEDQNIRFHQAEISNRMVDELPIQNQYVIKRVEELSAGLAESDRAEEQGK